MELGAFLYGEVMVTYEPPHLPCGQERLISMFMRNQNFYFGVLMVDEVSCIYSRVSLDAFSVL